MNLKRLDLIKNIEIPSVKIKVSELWIDGQQNLLRANHLFFAHLNYKHQSFYKPPNIYIYIYVWSPMTNPTNS